VKAPENVMNAFQLTALLPLLLGAVPAYLIANSIEREKNYSRLAGWDADRISDPDAYARLICNGIRSFAIVMGFVCLLRFAGVIGMRLYLPLMIMLPAAPLLYCVVRAKRKYTKRA
jgi:hypothetical protein